MNISKSGKVIVLLIVCGVLWGAYHLFNRSAADKSLTKTGTSSGSETIDTEDKKAPEIIVDESKLADLPKPKSDPKTAEEAEDASTSKVPKTFNLDIPFYAQAPDGDWTLPWKEACEEASLVLSQYFITDKALTLVQFKKDVLAMTKMQDELFGSYIDTTVAQTAELYNKFYGDGTAKIIDNPTIAQMKSELSQGHPIVAPFAGKKLGNSNFTNGGPRYHMLVIRGYDEKYFYTNDVGTRLGKNFPYSHATIMDALHDLVKEGEGDIATGAKKILVIMKK